MAAREIVGVATAAGGAFGSFYCFYSAAPLIFIGGPPTPGTRVAVLMTIVVLVQPLAPAEVWYQVQSVLTAHKSAAEATPGTTTTSKAPSTADSAGPGSSCPTPKTGTATSTATSSGPADTPNAPTVTVARSSSLTSSS